MVQRVPGHRSGSHAVGADRSWPVIAVHGAGLRWSVSVAGAVGVDDGPVLGGPVVGLVWSWAFPAGTGALARWWHAARELRLAMASATTAANLRLMLH